MQQAWAKKYWENIHPLTANYVYKFRFSNECYTGLALKQQCAHRTNVWVYLHGSPF